MNAGANTAVKKTIPDSQNIIDDQIAELGNFKKQLDANLSKLALKAKELETELTELVK